MHGNHSRFAPGAVTGQYLKRQPCLGAAMDHSADRTEAPAEKGNGSHAESRREH